MRKFSLITLILIVAAGFAVNFAVAASPFDTPAEVNIVIRDNAGNIIRKANFEIYHQVRDADGNLALGKKMASGDTGDLGRKIVKINVKPLTEAGQGNRFIFKIFVNETKTDAVFFYDNVIENNSHPNKTFKLNSIKISLFDASGIPLKDKKFTLYKEDVDDGECDCNKKKIISSSTGEIGCKELYLSGGKYSIEIPADGKLTYRKEFNVPSGRTELNYYLSVLDVSFRDSFGDIISNKKFEVYGQERNANNEFILGKKIGGYDTGDFGKKSILLPPGIYAIKFSGNAKQVYYINNIELVESTPRVVDYRLGGLKISYANESGDKKYDTLKGNIYYEEKDDSGKLKIGRKIIGVKIFYDEYENFELPRGSYVLAVGEEKFYNLSVCDNKENELTITKTASKYLYNFKNNCAISKGPDPANFIYGKKRLSSLAEEKKRAVILKKELEKIMGKGRIGVSAKNWHILVNSYIYGEYSPAEIADTIRCGPQAVHPTIVAPSWRKSGEYKKYLSRATF